jgi:pimeloyl-ACP methyl ester carboxylesterase
MEQVVLVAHSLSGILVPALTAGLGERVTHTVFVSPAVPRPSQESVMRHEKPYATYPETLSRGCQRPKIPSDRSHWGSQRTRACGLPTWAEQASCTSCSFLTVTEP